MIKVSVIVPVYNVDKYIRRCIASLVKQTLQGIEIIIVDDGSTDNSETIIKEYMKYNEQIKYFRKENGGLSDARNYGLKFASGEYVAFLDSDDYVEADMYEKMYKKALKEDSDMVECNFYWTYGRYGGKNKKDIGYRYYGKQEMFETGRVVAWNKLYKKSILDKANVKFPKGLQYEDVEFFYKMIPYLENVSFVKQPMVHYVQRKKSIINTSNERVSDIFIVLDNVISYYKEKRIYYEYKDVIEYTYTRLLLCSSLRRISKIKDKNTRYKLLNETWIRLNDNFPNWQENKILNTRKGLKNKYMLTINRFTYKIYTKIFRIF